MTLIAFLLICIFGMLLGLLAQPFARLSRLVAVGSLVAALTAALLLNPNDTATLGEVQLATTWFVCFFLTALTASCLMLCIVGLVTGWPERLAPAALATFAGVGFAISATDPTVALPGTIRGDLGRDWGEKVQQNIVHGSDSPESSAREIGIWFPELV